jgi:hypothetical protein
LNAAVPAGDGTNTWVWTGTLTSGNGGGANSLGPSATIGAIYGLANHTNGSWVSEDASLPRSDQFRIYGFTNVLTVPAGSASVPEPDSLLILVGLTLGSIGCCHTAIRKAFRKNDGL